MIYKLQKKLILISALSIFLLITLIFLLIAGFSVSSLNRSMDSLADSISSGGGKFPEQFGNNKPPRPTDKPLGGDFEFINPETPFSTRYFTVWFTEGGEVRDVNTDFIFSVDRKTAEDFAKEALADGNKRGWISNYRYKFFEKGGTRAAVFVNGSSNLASLSETLIISAIVLLCCAALTLLIIIIFSKRVVKPVAESYKKQKQFITDANHELKTPLTLILTNLDIAEAELGENEWLSDIRSEGERMTELVNSLVTLSRMDEDGYDLSYKEFSISDAVGEAVAEFEPLILARSKKITTKIDTGLIYKGDEGLIRRAIGILMDNAVKYCDEGGVISVSLSGARKRITLAIENSYSDIDSIPLDKLFDRFWRADKARTYQGGFGIGLSTARSIAERHGASITAYKRAPDIIGFKLVLISS